MPARKLRTLKDDWEVQATKLKAELLTLREQRQAENASRSDNEAYYDRMQDENNFLKAEVKRLQQQSKDRTAGRPRPGSAGRPGVAKPGSDTSQSSGSASDSDSDAADECRRVRCQIARAELAKLKDVQSSLPLGGAAAASAVAGGVSELEASALRRHLQEQIDENVQKDAELEAREAEVRTRCRERS